MGMNATLQNLLVDRIRPSPYQARQDFDERTIDDLARSIEKSGLSQPILVRPIAPDAEGPLYELVSGELRLRASRKLGRQRIWAIAEPMTDEEAALRGMLENIKRQDINVMERAKGYKTLTEPPFNLTMEEVAIRLGFKDNSTVSRIIDLLNQPPAIQNLLARASISERHVRYINKIKDLRKKIRWANVISKKGWSVQETEKRLNRALGNDRQKKVKDASTAAVAEVDVSGFRFRLQGDELVIGGRNFKLLKDVPQQFVEDFRGALDVAIRDLWISKHPEILAEAEAWKSSAVETESTADTSTAPETVRPATTRPSIASSRKSAADEPTAVPRASKGSTAPQAESDAQPDTSASPDDQPQEQLGEAIAGALEQLIGGEEGESADLSKLLGFLGGKKRPPS